MDKMSRMFLQWRCDDSDDLCSRLNDPTSAVLVFFFQLFSLYSHGLRAEGVEGVERRAEHDVCRVES